MIRLKSRLLAWLICLAPVISVAQDSQIARSVAITIDDLPAASDDANASAIVHMTAKLLQTLREQKVPAVGFVNESKIYQLGQVDENIKALQLWLDGGFELGNHTFSHMSLNQATLQAWEEDVVRGETVTKWLSSQHKMQLKYFRHPYLDTGRDLQTRRNAEAFLANRGYRIAPVTLDAWDWYYAPLYEDAQRKKDSQLQQELVKSYLAHSDATFEYWERLSQQVLGYEPKQILLLHANHLEADHIGDVVAILKKRGYRFITLADALDDQAYSLPDTYVGEEGTSWLVHWALSLGKPAHGAPTIPSWVADRAQALEEQRNKSK